MHLLDEMYEMEAMVKLKFRQYRSADPLDLGEALWVSALSPGTGGSPPGEGP